EDTVAAANHRLTPAKDIVGEADTRTQVVLVPRELLCQRGQGIDQVRKWFGQLLILIAQAQRKTQPRKDLPVISEIPGVIVVTEFEARQGKALGEGRIAGSPGAGVGRGQIREVIQQAAVAVTAKAVEEVL